MNTLQIGDVNLKNPFILAPMAGVTDLPFRVLCSEMGAGLNCMEMVSAKAITYHNKATWDMMKIDPRETCVSLQLFGSEPDVMAEAAKRIEELPFQIMDINMGCPVPKVVNNGEGSALMKNPVLVGQIVEAVAGAICKPLTVKIRAGFDEDSINAVEIARIAQESGAAAVAVHGRTRQQFYSGTADWEIIGRVKDALSIPVIGNGDVTDGESAKRLMKETGCDGIMIGRAARGNPWIFQNIIKYFETGEVVGKPPMEEMQQMILRHGKMLLECKGEYTAVREMRQHVAWYTSGYHNSAALRRRINEAESMEELERMVCGEKAE
ncbi:MAG: tRNA dihydrouridine synthase DusB [Lachnospiraceae bacterium]|nr:tRNA dihydrouridine synthase DusB [Lachnospiraceae bacterium]